MLYKSLEWFRERDRERAAWMQRIAQLGRIKILRWRSAWVTDGEYEVFTTAPTVWELERLDVSNPKALTYSGPDFRWVPTVITEVPLSAPQWPNNVTGETESIRRSRIRAIRRACHVDENKGLAEPTWRDEPARAETKLRDFGANYGKEVAGFSAAV